MASLCPASPASQAGAQFWGKLPGRLSLACASALAVLWAVASFWFPFGRDQGSFAAVGDAILRGGMPYRDAWEIKGPLAHYAFALAQWLFGRHTWSIRILDLPLLVAGAAALGRMVAKIASTVGGWWASIVFPLWIGSLTWTHTVQPDTWASILAVYVALLLVENKPALASLMVCGLAVGFAALVKPLYLLSWRCRWRTSQNKAGGPGAGG